MIVRCRSGRAGFAVMAIATFIVSMASAVLDGQDQGRLLIDALRALQATGLRIVFTSATVTPGMRVQKEPRAATPRQQLDELLAPHGLQAREGPRGILEIVRAQPANVNPRPADVGTIEGTIVDAVSMAPVPAPVTHREYVIVTKQVPFRGAPGVVAEIALDRGELNQLYGTLADDPARVVQALPRVTAVDDFRSEFAVRGSPLRHVELVVDGVSTPWLQHTAHRRGATGSLSMLPASVLEEATLRAGAYPHRHGNRIGPQLDLKIREGSRTGFIFRGALGGTNATLIGEGPLGGSARGSWLAAFRQSYLEWPTERPESTRTPFGFIDGMAKVVYDVADGHRATATVLAGTSNVDGDDNLAPNQLGDGSNQALVANLSWRSTLGAVLLTQQAYVVRHHSVNRRQTGETSDWGTRQHAIYRLGVSRSISDALLEAGAQIGRTAIDSVPRVVAARTVAASSSLRSAYVHVTWPVTSALTFSPGVRVDTSTHVAERSVTRWVLGEWMFRPGWTLNGSAGVAEQPPELDHSLEGAEPFALRPERGTHVDVGIEQRPTDSSRWQVTAFSRREDDILREPDGHPRFAGGEIVPPESRYVNALRGTSRGIELLVDRRSPRGLSGWAAYSFGKTHYIDAVRHESFWGDFDQRHAVTLFGSYRFSDHTGIGATFRSGSNFPIPAYLITRADGLYVGPQRNQLRLPVYSRLDLRADHEFKYLGQRVALFVEMLNALNRANAGLASGSIDPVTGQATGFIDALFRRRAAAGIRVEF